MSYRARRHARLLKRAAESFGRHVIDNSDGRRWLIRQREPDGTLVWCPFWVEVVALEMGIVYVGGDIDHVLFSYGDKGQYESNVRWMGEHTDLEYYVKQKACIGTGRELIELFDLEAAVEDLRGWVDDERDSFEPDQAIIDKLEHVIACPDPYDLMYSQLRFVEFLHEELGYQYVMERGDVGTVLAPRVYFAHAALTRLCALLDEEVSEKAS